MTMVNEWEPEHIHAVLADDRVQQILTSLNVSNQSAQDLIQICEGSQSSIYRRLAVLQSYDLVTEQTKVSDSGHHYSVYQPHFDDIRIFLDDDQLVTEIQTGDEIMRYAESPLTSSSG